MDKIKLNLKNKRVHSVGISQAINVKKLVDEFIEENNLTDNVVKLYVGYDDTYFETLGFDNKYTELFHGEMTSPSEVDYKLVKDIPHCKCLIVYIDTYVDVSITNQILNNVDLDTHIIYIFDNTIVDYSDGEFYKRYINVDSSVLTFNRRPDIKVPINTLLNKLKKYNIKYLNAQEIQNSEYDITYEQIKDEELLDYDKIILVNNTDTSEYNIRVRNILGRGFLPEERDRMINYTPINVKIYNSELGQNVDLYIPIYTELTVVGRVTELTPLVAPIYKFKYNDMEFTLPINLGFIDELNLSSVSKEDIPMSFSGYKLYFAYAIPMYAIRKRYDKPLLIVDDSILNINMIYTAIASAKETFKLTYESNVYLG